MTMNIFLLIVFLIVGGYAGYRMSIADDWSMPRYSHTQLIIFLFLGSLCTLGGVGLGSVTMILLIGMVVRGRDSRWHAILAMVSLAMIVSMLVSSQQLIAEQWAVFLYYMLVISVIGALYQDSNLRYKIDHRIQALSKTNILRYRYSFFVLGIVAIIMGPLRRNGFIFALDHVLPPDGFHDFTGSAWILVPAFYNSLSLIIPSRIVEKLILSLSIIGGLYGMKKLISGTTTSSIYALILGGISIVFNPFFYGRFVDGQSNVYMSLLCLPRLVYMYHKRWSGTITFSAAVGLGLSAFVYTGLSTHNLIFIAVASIVFGLSYISLSRDWLKKTMIAGAIIVVACLPRVFRTTGDVSSLVSKVDQTHLQVFQAVSLSGSSIGFTLATLHGYRGENTTRFMPSFGANQQWRVVWMMMLSVVIYGARKPSRLGIALICMGGISFVLAAGTWFGATDRLYQHVYRYRGLREPHKWLMWLALAYAYFGALGLHKIINRRIDLEKWILHSYWTFITILPILSVPMLLRGARGQIVVANYPADRYTLKTSLVSCRSQQCKSILVLPWHGYLSFPFTSRITVNPVGGFMNSPNLIISDTVEIGGLYSQTDRLQNKALQEFLPGLRAGDLSRDTISQLRTYVTTYSVSSVIAFDTPILQSDQVWIDRLIDLGFLKLTTQSQTYRQYIFTF